MANILIVEDEFAINMLIQKNLQLVGHNCTCVYDGKSALTEIDRTAFELAILDVMLPEIDGFELYKKTKGIPTIFLTAKSSLSDRLNGLNMGADDYITKPFEMLELLARVNAVLRRTKSDNDVFEFDNVKIDFNSRKVFLYDKNVDFTPQEYGLLEVLVNNRNIALSRDKLLELAWGYDYEGDTRTIDVHIQKLRKKLNWENNIKTVYKLGYRLETKSK